MQPIHCSRLHLIKFYYISTRWIPKNTTHAEFHVRGGIWSGRMTSLLKGRNLKLRVGRLPIPHSWMGQTRNLAEHVFELA